MRTSFLAFVTSSVLVGASLMATPAEARRLFWWEAGGPPIFDAYGDYPDAQDAYVQDQFNQDEYDLYIEQTHKRRKIRYNDTYFDPQVDDQNYYLPRKQVKKKKIIKQVVVVKPAPVYKAKPVMKKIAVAPNSVAPSLQTVSLGKRFKEPSLSKSVDCTKGASIVSGFGFDAVTTKSCSGGTYIYGATRSGKSFEVQVSATTGELTAVKKL
jgi:hypothetical protein